jgi:hypothetical protein
MEEAGNDPLLVETRSPREIQHVDAVEFAVFTLRSAAMASATAGSAVCFSTENGPDIAHRSHKRDQDIMKCLHRGVIANIGERSGGRLMPSGITGSLIEQVDPKRTDDLGQRQRRFGQREMRADGSAPRPERQMGETIGRRAGHEAGRNERAGSLKFHAGAAAMARSE